MDSFGGGAASDDCDTLYITNDFVSIIPSCGIAGSEVVTFTATDGCGNTATITATVTIEDTTAPILIDVPNDTIVDCHSIPVAPTITAVDSCDLGGTVTINLVETTTPGVGCLENYTLTREWTATDECGNTQVLTQVITVQDTCLLYTSPSPRD